MQSWLLDIIAAALLSIGVNGLGAALIALAAHGHAQLPSFALHGVKRHSVVAKTARDVAMIGLFFDLGSRCGEVVSLDVEHVREGRIWILGKGRSQREWLTLPEATAAAVARWLDVRSTVPDAEPEAMFLNLMREKARSGKRITHDGVHKVVKGLGEAVGLQTRPHGLRHASITDALDAGSDPRSVQKHARHASLETTMRYDDNRQDLAGNVARSLADVLSSR